MFISCQHFGGHRFLQKLIFDQSDTITNILALHIIDIEYYIIQVVRILLLDESSDMISIIIYYKLIK